MRRVIIVSLLFFLMRALQFLQVDVETPFNPKSLATLGFVLLAAYTLGEIAGAFGMPRITGYILTGVLCGPQIINLFSSGVVSDLKLINELAIGLIALTAGGEMRWGDLKQVGKSLSFIVLIKGAITIAAITAAVYFSRPLIPFLSDAAAPLVLSVGFIFSVLALGTSPAATIAVINETGSRGRLTNITLGTAVGKDVVMVVLLALGIAFAALFSTPGASFDAGVLRTVGLELLFSLLAGAVLGGIIIAYVRFVHAEMWLFIIALILLANAFAEQVHLEALLMFITAGFVVQNFSKHGDGFIHPIEAVSLPVYVVFFSIAGADLDLGALQQVWLIALILVSVRIAAIYAGTRFATAAADESADVRRFAWLCFIAQAGVVLGLALIVEKNLPGLGAEIKIIVLATIAVNLLLGPITFKMALSRTGETREARDKRSREKESAPDVGTPDEEAPAPSLPQVIKLSMPEFESTELNREAMKVREGLSDLVRDLEESLVDERTNSLRAFIGELRDRHSSGLQELGRKLRGLSSGNRMGRIHAFRESRIGYSRWIQGKVTGLAASEAATEITESAFEKFFAAVSDFCSHTRAGLTVVQEEVRFLPLPEDTFFIRAGKRVKRIRRRLRKFLASGGRPNRGIHFRKLAQFHFDGQLPSATAIGAGMAAAQTLYALRKARSLYASIDDSYEEAVCFLEEKSDDSSPSADLHTWVDTMRRDLDADFRQAEKDLQQFGEDSKKHLRLGLARVYDGFLLNLRTAGTFELPARRFRLSKVYEESQASKKGILKDCSRWKTLTSGFAGNLSKHIEVVMLMDEVSRVVDETVFQVLENMDRKLVASVNGLRDRCEWTLQRLREGFDNSGTDPAHLSRIISDRREEISRHIHEDVLPGLRQLRDSRELNALLDMMLQRFTSISDEMPAEYKVLDERMLDRLEQGVLPRDLRLSSVPIREITRSYLETEMARNLTDVNRVMFEQVDDSLHSVGEVLQIANFNLRAAAEDLLRDPKEETEESGNHPRELALGGLERAVARLNANLDKIHSVEEDVYQKIIAKVDDQVRDLETLILEKTTFDIQVQLRRRRLVTRALAFAQGAWRWLKLRYRALRIRYGPISHEVVKDLRLTLGLAKFTPTEIMAIYDQAGIDDVVKKLPFIYQRLFDITPLESGDFLIARDDEIRIIQTARARWEQGMRCSIAIVGELGSGKTSFINVMVRQLFGEYSVFQKSCGETVYDPEVLAHELAQLLDLPGVTGFADLEARILAREGKSIIVLEDAHKLYLRTLGGFEAMRGLLLLIANTSKKILWVLSIREYAWRYLDRVLGISDSFTFAVNMENASRDELEQVILSRNRVSGFDLHFHPDEAMKQRKKYRKLSREEDRQEMARREFFDQMSKAAGGNILSALFYWLRSIDGSRENILDVNPLHRLSFDFLQDMNVEKLLTLGMISQHGSLTADEHAKVFGSDEQSSLSILSYLSNINLLVKQDNGSASPCFMINRVIYKPLSAQLSERNILH